MVLIERFAAQRLKKVGHLSAPWYQAHTESGEKRYHKHCLPVFLSTPLHHPTATSYNYWNILGVVMSTSPSFPTLNSDKCLMYSYEKNSGWCWNIARELELVFWFECQDVDVFFCKVLLISHVEFQIALIFDILANSNSWTSNY